MKRKEGTDIVYGIDTWNGTVTITSRGYITVRLY